MKTLIILALMAYAAADDDHYVLEKVDVAALTTNVKELKKFNDCLINKGPCTELYQSYKVLVPESVKQACFKCTPELKKFAYQYFESLKTHMYEDYILFKQLYDPENKYFDILENEINKYKTV